MDLGNIQQTESSDLQLLHPATGKPLSCDDGSAMTITLFGSDSDRYRKLMFDLRRKAALEKADASAMSYEDSQKEAVEVLAQCTAGWNIQVGGEKPKFTLAAARDLYNKSGWIRDQVDTFIHRRTHFLSDASKG